MSVTSERTTSFLPPRHPLSRQDRMTVRQAALSAAVYLVDSVSDATVEFSLPRVLAAADTFAHWIETGERPDDSDNETSEVAS